MLKERPYQEVADFVREDGGSLRANRTASGGTTSLSTCDGLSLGAGVYWRARLQRKSASTWQEAPANHQGTTHSNAFQGYKEAEHLLEQAAASGAGWQQEWIQLQLAQLFPRRSSVDETTIVLEKVQPLVEQHGTAEQCVRFYLAVCLKTLSVIVMR